MFWGLQWSPHLSQAKTMPKKDLDETLEDERAMIKAYRGLDYQHQLEAAQQRRKAYLAKFRGQK
jgi:hypothetical protein